MRIPGGVILAVLGGDAGGRAVRPAKHDRAMHLAARHIERLGGGVDDVVDRLHGEVPGHELDDGLEPAKAAPTPTPAKPYSVMGVSTTRVGPNSSSRPWRHFIGALILGDLLAHEEHIRIGAHLLGHGVAQRLAHGHGDHLGAGRNFRLGARLGGRALRPAGAFSTFRQAPRPDGRGLALLSSRPWGEALARLPGTGLMAARPSSP